MTEKKCPVLTIIIVKYKSEAYLPECLKSIGKNKDIEIIVVDNDKSNIGYGAGCNQGAKEARGKYLFFLNPDTVVLNDSLLKMVEFMEENPSVAVLGPKLYKNFEKEKQLSFCRFPDPFTAVFVFSPLTNIWKNNPIFSHYVYSENIKDNGILPVDAVAGAAILIRKDIFKKVGGFDENFFLYFEENDLCQRVRKTEGEIVYFPKAGIIHFGGKSTLQFPQRDEIFRQSRKFFFRKQYGDILGVFTESLIRALEKAAFIVKINGIF